MAKVTEREAAKELGKSRAALQDARKRGDLLRSVSRDARGRLRIDVEVAREELEEAAALRVTAEGEGGEALQRWRAARARLAEAQAALTEDELRKSRGELVEAAKVEARLVEVFSSCKVKLLGIPTAIRSRLPHLILRDISAIDEAIREALADLGGGKS